MLKNQWFVVAAGNGHASVAAKTLPADHKRKVLNGMRGSMTVFHGPTVLVEDRADTFALAIGDTRSLSDLDGFRQSGPSRHAGICVIDKETLAIRVITDRVNFSKIFCSNSADGLVLSTHLTLLARKQLKLSINGLASVIANGTQFNNLTVYEDVRVLERASIHEFAGGLHRGALYWQYGFESSLSKSAAKQQLKDAIVDSIRDQICDRPILLSLSGGFDSSGILGVLAKHVKPQSLNTFSYVFGNPKPNTDALVARKMADLTGYPHETIQAWDGDILATFRRNAQLGQGLSNFCDEIDAWHRQAQVHAGSIVLAGDECFGWADRRLVSMEDVLVTVCLRRFESVAPLIPYLDSSVAREMTDGLAAEIDRVMGRTSQSNLHDKKDFLYLDQRIPWGLLPWRRFIIGEHFEVREPFLHTPLLEVIKTLPVGDRVGKRLYREAIQELAPEVFSIPRARTGQASPDWRQEVLKNRLKIEELLKLPSQLDSIIGPSAIVALLSNLEQAAPPKRNLKLVIRQIVGPAATRLLRSFVRPETPRFQSAEPILKRLLVLREFLGNEWTVE